MGGDEKGRPYTYSLWVTESPAVNFTSVSLRLQLTSEGALHVLWMRWKGWKRRREDGEGVITQRWNRRGKQLSSASLLFVHGDILAWAVSVHLGESGKYIDTLCFTCRHIHTDLIHSQKTGFWTLEALEGWVRCFFFFYHSLSGAVE